MAFHQVVKHGHPAEKLATAKRTETGSAMSKAEDFASPRIFMPQLFTSIQIDLMTSTYLKDNI